jgi:hypothetical protein
MRKRSLHNFNYVYSSGRRHQGRLEGLRTDTYETPEEAAVAIDRLIVDELEPDDDFNVGRWSLNFPHQWPTPSHRRIINARKRGDVFRLYGQYITPDDLEGTADFTPIPESPPDSAAGKFLTPDDESIVQVLWDAHCHRPYWDDAFPTYERFRLECDRRLYREKYILPFIETELERVKPIEITR